MNEDWELLLNIDWPHNKLAIGYEYVPANKEEPYQSVFLHLGFITIIFHWT